MDRVKRMFELMLRTTKGNLGVGKAAGFDYRTVRAYRQRVRASGMRWNHIKRFDGRKLRAVFRKRPAVSLHAAPPFDQLERQYPLSSWRQRWIAYTEKDRAAAARCISYSQFNRRRKSWEAEQGLSPCALVVCQAAEAGLGAVQLREAGADVLGVGVTS